MINNSATSKICTTKTFLLEVLIRKRGVLLKTLYCSYVYGAFKGS